MGSLDSMVEHQCPCTFYVLYNLIIVLSYYIKGTSLTLGTAGVWRISALNEAGGWQDRTIVEDMDLAVRAYLNGWKFVFVDNIKVYNQ